MGPVLDLRYESGFELFGPTVLEPAARPRGKHVVVADPQVACDLLVNSREATVEIGDGHPRAGRQIVEVFCVQCVMSGGEGVFLTGVQQGPGQSTQRFTFLSKVL